MNKKVIFNYVYDKNYNPENFTGILSSISMDNSLILNFYSERNALPKQEIYDVNEDGDLDEKTFVSIPDNKNYINLVRHIKSGLILDIDGAKNLLELLEEYIDLVEKNETDETDETDK